MGRSFDFWGERVGGYGWFEKKKICILISREKILARKYLAKKISFMSYAGKKFLHRCMSRKKIISPGIWEKWNSYPNQITHKKVKWSAPKLNQKSLIKLDIYTHLLALRYHGLPLNSQRSQQMSQLLEVLKQTLRQNDWDTDGLFENPYHRNQRMQFQLICTAPRQPAGQIRPPCWIQVSKSQSPPWNKITLYARNACKRCRNR